MIERLVLWRHGRTEWNAAARFQGQSDPGLDDVGLEQARGAAPLLAREAPTAIFSSDLRRASVTAQQLSLATGVPVVEDAALRETFLGRWEGLTRDEVERTFPEEMSAWQDGETVRRGGGETAAEVADRAAAFLASVDGGCTGTVVLVAHGGTIKALTARLLGLPDALWMRLSPLANCHWTVLRRDLRYGDSWRLHGHNLGRMTAVPTPTDAAADVTPNVDADNGLR